jgi:hypothetical protein
VRNAELGKTMLTYTRNELIHWNYYIALENDLENISRFIEFSKKNEKTYSIELSKLLMAASSEIDVVMKMFCSLLETREYRNIDDYRNCIINRCPDFIKEEIIISQYGLKYKPWSNWTSKNIKNPDWWKAYNNVKHQRNIFYHDANLKNVLNSMGGLLILLIYYYKCKSGNNFKDTTKNLIPYAKLLKINANYYFSIRIC